MGMLIKGKWSTEWYKPDKKGRFVRNDTVFHNLVTKDGSSGFKAEHGRYHLYLSYACPWAHRTLIMRNLKGLERAISISIVDPYMGDDGWTFSDCPECIPDNINGCKYLREVYIKSDPKYTGRVTVPVLWDRESGTIVNNESRQIMRMLDTEFGDIGNGSPGFYPERMREKINKRIDQIYNPVNNGVYRTGFATTQEAYDEAVSVLFDALTNLDTDLGKEQYLCGDIITEADWCLFSTLIRFDMVYYTHFKCNVRHIYEYENLWRFLKELYNLPGVSETCNFDHIKSHYYSSHRHINPYGIIPSGPEISFDQ